MVNKLTAKEQIGTTLNFLLGQKDLSVAPFVMVILIINIVPLSSTLLGILLLSLCPRVQQIVGDAGFYGVMD